MDINEFASALKDAKYIYLIPAVSCMLLSFWFRALRWKYLMEPIKKIGTKKLFSATMIGYMGNNVLPFRLGELLRAYAIGKSARVSKVSSFASIFVERIIDMFSLLMILAIIFIFYPFPEWIKRAGYIIFTLTVGLLIFAIFLRNNTPKTVSFFRSVLRALPQKFVSRIENFIESFSKGLTILSKTRHYGIIFLLSAILWPLYVGSVWFLFFSFDFNLNILAGFVVLIFGSIAITIPSAPGYVGTFHGFTVAALALFGIQSDPARAYAVILHASNYVPITLLGLLFFWKEHLHFSEVSFKQMEKEKL
jgi:uncharacterized protein (TIRG00374 family)